MRHEHVLVAIPVLQAEDSSALVKLPKNRVVLNKTVLQVCIRSDNLFVIRCLGELNVLYF